ncbi:hypothetical protein [uncultured Methanobrevibacter sp.]|uniref:hypothetical protein n=1 Tax=uncultured Methanobrevibacter sp. TaxID=253161 RepID=UPI00262EEA5B|nr:hypothetical protein [uncultured Methanobrevibacter sp.]
MSNKEKILILSVGGSPEPLIYSINDYQPDRIVFVHTPETLHYCGEILDSIDWDKGEKFITGLSILEKSYNEEYELFKANNNIETYLDFNQVKNLPSYDNMVNFLTEQFSDILEISDLNDERIFLTEISDAEDLEISFDISQKVISKFDDADKYEVFVDFTGGTKPMVSGMVLSVIEGDYSNFMLCYVGSIDDESRNKIGVGNVQSGKEFIKRQINPYQSRAITEFKRGINFFNQYQFEGAELNFKNANKNFKSIIKNKESQEEMGDVSVSNHISNVDVETIKNNRSLALRCIEFVEFYNKWDLFNDEFGRNTLLSQKIEEIIEKIENSDYLINLFEGTDFYNQIKLNHEFLKIKIENEDLSLRLKFYLADLLNNSCRRYKEGKYNDAVARLYRANELISQIKLFEKDLYFDEKIRNDLEFILSIDKILANVGKYNYIDAENIIKRNFRASKEEREKFKALYGKNYDIHGELKLANDQNYDLLEVFGFEKTKEFEKFNCSLKSRNTSILAHGLNPIKKNTAKKLYNNTLEYASGFFPDLEDIMEMGKFPKLDSNIIRKQ